MTVWMFLDEYASLTAGDRAREWNEENPDKPPREPVDVEYEDVEALLREAFAGETILFSRGKRPHELANQAPTIYLWDIGGMDGCTGSRRGQFSRDVIEQVAEHQDTIFIPWSSFTQRYAEGALCDLLGDECWADGRIPHNVIILDAEQVRKCYDLDNELLGRLRTLYQARGK